MFDRYFNGDSTRERPESDAQLNLRNSEGDFESKMGEREGLSLLSDAGMKSSLIFAHSWQSKITSK